MNIIKKYEINLMVKIIEIKNYIIKKLLLFNTFVCLFSFYYNSIKLKKKDIKLKLWELKTYIQTLKFLDQI